MNHHINFITQHPEKYTVAQVEKFLDAKFGVSGFDQLVLLLKSEPYFFIKGLTINPLNRYFITHPFDNQYNPSNSFSICFGNVDNYTAYDLTELINAIKPNQVYQLYDQRAKLQQVGYYQVENLYQLIKSIEPDQLSNQLINQIDLSRSKLTWVDQYCLNKIRQFHFLESKYLIVDCLITAFQVGMYFRGWTGKVGQYPLKVNQIESDSTQIRNKLIGQISALSAENSRFLENLMVVQHIDGNQIYSNQFKFGDLWSDVVGHEIYSVEAGSYLIGTGYYYATKFNDKVRFDGYHLKQLN